MNDLEKMASFFGADALKMLNVKADAETEEAYTALRGETPHSDKLDSPDTGIAMGDYASQSPDHAATSSDRDESPDTVSSPCESANQEDVKPSLLENNQSILGQNTPSIDEQTLQQQILRLSGIDPSSLSRAADMKQEPAAHGSNPMQQSMAATSALHQHLQQLIQQNPALQAMNSQFTAASQAQMPSSLQHNNTAAKPVITPTQPDGTPTPQKRKRQRRNPVWPYFDVIDGTALCKQCLYSTKSVFSTNLKVHLRSHHRSDYEKVIEAEDALNLNALLLSGNSGAFLGGRSGSKRSLPPMTTSILHTINKLANQAQNPPDQNDVLNSVLRQTLASGNLQQQMMQAQAQAKSLSSFNLQNAAAQLQANLLASRQLATALAAQNTQQQERAQTPQQQAQQQQNQQQQNQQQQQEYEAPSTPGTPQAQTPNSQQLAAEQFFKQFRINFPTGMSSTMSASSPIEAPQPKRRRLRRHPVWMYFRDLEDRMVGCISCNFRTGSAFSTNLKMHLKAHHKDAFEKVVKLEEEMRIEAGILGPPNKMKSELIDFIRGGGNASQAPSPTAPRPSPLVQQIIQQTMSGRNSPMGQNQMHGGTADVVTGGVLDEETVSKLSMGDRLAALVGLGQMKQEEPVPMEQMPEDNVPISESANDNIFARLGLLPPQQAFGQLMGFHQFGAGAQVPAHDQLSEGLSGVDTENSSGQGSECPTSRSSSEGDAMKQARDKALQKLLVQYDFLADCQEFKTFVHTLAPEYEFPCGEEKRESGEEENTETGNTAQNNRDVDSCGQIHVHMPALMQ